MAAMAESNDEDDAGGEGGPAGAFEGDLAAPVVVVVVMAGAPVGAVTFMVVVTGIWLVVLAVVGGTSGASVGAATGASATGAELVGVLVLTGAGETALPMTGGPPAVTGASVGVVAFGNKMARSSALKSTSPIVWMIPLLA
jgi:hypothetical protein